MQLNDIPFDDKKTFDMLSKGLNVGVFQLNEGWVRGILRDVKPDCFEDIVALVSLVRPGSLDSGGPKEYAARKRSGQTAPNVHPELDEALTPILANTYGLILYQEQVMEIAQKLAGYSLGEADMLRRAMGKKKPEVLAAEYPKFSEGMWKHGNFSMEATEALWELLLPFADYAFNRCITGDTVITRSVAGSHGGREWTVKELYDCWHGPRTPMRNKLRATATGLKIMARDAKDHRIRPDRIKGVFYQGVQHVWKITLADGKSITATANHRHLTKDGWKRVDRITQSDYLATMGNVEPSRGTDPSTGNPPCLKNGLHLLRREIRDIGHCEWCSKTDCRLEIAHLDSDRKNNDRSNLKLLCGSCHKKHDYKTGSRKRQHSRGRPIVWSRVVSIEYAGEQDTYDLEMGGEDHSWVGNGIVTHNSHAVGYALISYWTAYLKANYPAEFIAALMTGDAADQAKIKEYINEAKRLGIDVLPPSINESDLGFTPTKEGIRFGLAAIKGIGPSVIQGILDQRPYASFDRFIWEAHPTVRNSRVLKALTESGSLDSLWTERLQVLREIERLSGLARDHRAKHERGERTLFRIKYTPKARTTSDLFAGSKRERIKQGELDTIGIQLTFPSIVLKTDKELSASEIAFVKTVLESRVPESNVYVQTGSVRAKLGVRSSFKGLSSALSKIGVEVYEV